MKNLKEKIKAKENVDFDSMKLVFEGKVLEDNNSQLSVYDLEDGSVLNFKSNNIYINNFF